MPVRGRGGWRLSRRRAASAAVVGLLILAAVAGGAWVLGRLGGRAPVNARFVVPMPAGFVLERGAGPSLVVSPDGSQLVFVALQPGGGTQLFSRALDRFEATALPGTQGASAPFFSPDGRWIGFYAGGALQKVSIDGGAPLKISDGPAVWSAVWGPDQQIVFAAAVTSNGLRRVPADGGTPEELTIPRADRGELQHSFPQLLPGGTRVLFSIMTTAGWRPDESGRSEVYVQPYPGPAAKWPISTDGGTEPAWSSDGRELFYRRGEQMLAVPLQTEPQFSAGKARVLFEGAFETMDGARNYDVTPDGQRFIMVRGDNADTPQRFHVVLNWLDELKTRASARR